MTADVSRRLDPRRLDPPFPYTPPPDLGAISTSRLGFKGPYGAHWEIGCAGAVLVIIATPVVLRQRFICNGFTAGATRC